MNIAQRLRGRRRQQELDDLDKRFGESMDQLKEANSLIYKTALQVVLQARALEKEAENGVNGTGE